MADTELLDPCEDKELMLYAFDNGATHIAIESGFPYMAINGETYFFKRHGSRIDKIASELEPDGMDSCDFIKVNREGSIYENLDKMREHFLESCTPVVLYGISARGKSLTVSLLGKVDGLNAVESYSLYGMGAADERVILSEVIATTAAYSADQSIVFSTTQMRVAEVLKNYMPVFYLDDDRTDVLKHI